MPEAWLCAAQKYEAEACRLPHMALALDFRLPYSPRAELGTKTAWSMGAMQKASSAPVRHSCTLNAFDAGASRTGLVPVSRRT